MSNFYFPPRRAFLLLLMIESPFLLEHLLESTAVILSATCLSRNNVNCGITVMFESFDIFTSSLPLNIRGALSIYVLLHK